MCELENREQRQLWIRKSGELCPQFEEQHPANGPYDLLLHSSAAACVICGGFLLH